MRLRCLLIFCALVLLKWPPACSAASKISTDGRFFSFSSQNDSYAQVLDTFRQETGVEYDIPPEMRNQRIPMVEVKGLTLKSALVKILEGSNFDYILISTPEDPEKVRKLIVTGRSVQAASPTGPGATTAAAVVPRRINRQMAEDPFGGGELDVVDVPPGALAANEFVLERPDRGLGQGIVPCRRLRLTSLVISELFG